MPQPTPLHLITNHRMLIPLSSSAASPDCGRALRWPCHYGPRPRPSPRRRRRGYPLWTDPLLQDRPARRLEVRVVDAAQSQRWCAERDAAVAAAAAVDDRTALLIAELRHDRMCASMVDSLPAHLAAVAAVNARAAVLGVRL